MTGPCTAANSHRVYPAIGSCFHIINHRATVIAASTGIFIVDIGYIACYIIIPDHIIVNIPPVNITGVYKTPVVIPWPPTAVVALTWRNRSPSIIIT